MLAEVILKLGRWHLRVAGVIVATEGDTCRDWSIPDRLWTEESLKAVAERINGKRHWELKEEVQPYDPR